MVQDRLKGTHLIVPKAQALLEVLDHLFDLPTFRIVLDDVDSRQVDIRTDQIADSAPFLFDDDQGHFTDALDGADELGDFESLILAVQTHAHLSVGRGVRLHLSYLCASALEKDHGVGFELTDHMVTATLTGLNQGLSPIPTVGQDIELAGHRELKRLNQAFDHGDFGLKGTTTSDPFRVVEPCGKGQEKFFVEQGPENPLVAKDIGHLLGMILIPSTSGNLFPCLFDDRVIDDKEEDGASLDSQGTEESLHGDLSQLLGGPTTFSEETSEGGKGSLEIGMGQRLNHGGGVSFLSQLDESHNESGEDSERRS